MCGGDGGSLWWVGIILVLNIPYSLVYKYNFLILNMFFKFNIFMIPRKISMASGDGYMWWGGGGGRGRGGGISGYRHRRHTVEGGVGTNMR
jgi:hypothetical protein